MIAQSASLVTRRILERRSERLLGFSAWVWGNWAFCIVMLIYALVLYILLVHGMLDKGTLGTPQLCCGLADSSKIIWGN